MVTRNSIFLVTSVRTIRRPGLAAGHRPARKEVCRAAPNQPLELVKDVRIPPSLGYFLFHRLQRIGDGKGLLIRSVGGQGVININNLQHTRGNRDSLAPKPIRVARAVELLVVMPDDRKYKTERFQWRTNALAYYRMLADNCPFVGRQSPRLQQNRIRHGNLSNVVHDSGTTQRGNLILKESQLFT